MSHFLRLSEVRDHALGRAHAAVRVRVLKHRPRVLVLDPDEDEPILILANDALVVALPKDVTVVTPEGEPVTSNGQFFVTTESLDPYHAVLDLSGA